MTRGGEEESMFNVYPVLPIISRGLRNLLEASSPSRQ